MKEKIKKVLERHKDSQANLASDSFRDMLATEIAANLELKEDGRLEHHTNLIAEGIYPWHNNEDKDNA
tara:strand:+ start:181 stop:384 length:204 start_codon:yes stop_codon:yes gene_type:complete